LLGRDLLQAQLEPAVPWAGPRLDQTTLALLGQAVFVRGAGLPAWFRPIAPEVNSTIFLFSEMIQIYFNFQNSYQIYFLSSIHETSFIILLNLRCIQEKYKTQTVGLELNGLS
jgi:hypothetical protein